MFALTIASSTSLSSHFDDWAQRFSGICRIQDECGHTQAKIACQLLFVCITIQYSAVWLSLTTIDWVLNVRIPCVGDQNNHVRSTTTQLCSKWTKFSRFHWFPTVHRVQSKNKTKTKSQNFIYFLIRIYSLASNGYMRWDIQQRTINQWHDIWTCVAANST